MTNNEKLIRFVFEGAGAPTIIADMDRLKQAAVQAGGGSAQAAREASDALEDYAKAVRSVPDLPSPQIDTSDITQAQTAVDGLGRRMRDLDKAVGLTEGVISSFKGGLVDLVVTGIGYAGEALLGFVDTSEEVQAALDAASESAADFTARLYDMGEAGALVEQIDLAAQIDTLRQSLGQEAGNIFQETWRYAADGFNDAWAGVTFNQAAERLSESIAAAAESGSAELVDSIQQQINQAFEQGDFGAAAAKRLTDELQDAKAAMAAIETAQERLALLDQKAGGEDLRFGPQLDDQRANLALTQEAEAAAARYADSQKALAVEIERVNILLRDGAITQDEANRYRLEAIARADQLAKAVQGSSDAEREAATIKAALASEDDKLATQIERVAVLRAAGLIDLAQEAAYVEQLTEAYDKQSESVKQRQALEARAQVITQGLRSEQEQLADRIREINELQAAEALSATDAAKAIAQLRNESRKRSAGYAETQNLEREALSIKAQLTSAEDKQTDSFKKQEAQREKASQIIAGLRGEQELLADRISEINELQAAQALSADQAAQAIAKLRKEDYERSEEYRKLLALEQEADTIKANLISRDQALADARERVQKMEAKKLLTTEQAKAAQENLVKAYVQAMPEFQAYEAARARGEAIEQEALTTKERLALQQSELNELYAQSALSQVAYARKSTEIAEALAQLDPAYQLATSAAERFVSGAGSVFDSILDGSQSARDAVSDLAAGFAQDLASMAAQVLLLEPLLESLKASLSGLSDGGGLGGGLIASILGVTPRASGGPVASGQAYLVGEQGPELIVPQHDGMVLPTGVLDALRKPSGGGDVRVVINNHGTAVQAQTRQDQGAQGTTITIDLIERTMSDLIARGRLDTPLALASRRQTGAL